MRRRVPSADCALVFALQLYWLPRGLIELGYRLTVEALARNGAQVRDLERSGALYAASQLAYFMGAYAEAKQHGEECLSIARECAARERAAAALLMLGYAFDALDERTTAQAQFEESATLARALGDKERPSFALNALAGHHAETDDLNLAEPLYEEALTLAREMHDLESIALDLPNLARVLVDRGDAERVRAMLHEALAIAQEIGSTRAAQNVVEVAVGLAMLHAEWKRAARFFGFVQAQMEQLGLRRTPVDDAFLAGRIGKVRAAIGDAAFEAAETAGRSLSLEEGLSEARAWLKRRD